MTLLPDLGTSFRRFHPQHPPTLEAPAAQADDVTLITAFFDIGRGAWGARGRRAFARGVEDYLGYFANLAKIRNRMVVFVDEHLAPEVLRLRREAGNEAATIIYTHPDLLGDAVLAPLRQLIAARMTPLFSRFVWRPDAPEYRSPQYVLVNVLKAPLVCAAIALGDVTAQAAWIDFGYCRDARRFDPAQPWRFQANGRMNLFHLYPLDERPVFEVVRRGYVYFMGGSIIGPAQCWPAFRGELDSALRSLTECGLIDDDQTLLLMAWRRNPQSYLVHPVHPSDWFVLFRRFGSAAVPEAVTLPARRVRRTPVWLHELRRAILGPRLPPG
ncbi:MAG TPA: WlaTC/HtrL family glycosyltransferase [Steroidobacteraceae bacterium]|nr:WlaTC/HtrL family glycosyltransferase [Steroidobacteraceae bacterium]